MRHIGNLLLKYFDQVILKENFDLKKILDLDGHPDPDPTKTWQREFEASNVRTRIAGV